MISVPAHTVLLRKEEISDAIRKFLPTGILESFHIQVDSEVGNSNSKNQLAIPFHLKHRNPDFIRAFVAANS